ncbi:hypothetical protein, partial [Segatella maculosa]|uniref:hypothetical protein n=1 Tax=Segatella maculosa TaxID=439703 RepID=UPI0024909B5E
NPCMRGEQQMKPRGGDRMEGDVPSPLRGSRFGGIGYRGSAVAPPLPEIRRPSGALGNPTRVQTPNRKESQMPGWGKR